MLTLAILTLKKKTFNIRNGYKPTFYTFPTNPFSNFTESSNMLSFMILSLHLSFLWIFILLDHKIHHWHKIYGSVVFSLFLLLKPGQKLFGKRGYLFVFTRKIFGEGAEEIMQTYINVILGL